MTNMDGKTLIDEFVRRIVEAIHPLRIILFGSWARGEQSENSDLDALVIVPDGTHSREAARAVYRNLAGLGYAADVVVATPSVIERHKDNPVLVYRKAMIDGKELYRAAA